MNHSRITQVMELEYESTEAASNAVRMNKERDHPDFIVEYGSSQPQSRIDFLLMVVPKDALNNLEFEGLSFRHNCTINVNLMDEHSAMSVRLRFF